MNSKGITALKDAGVCMKCLNKKATHFYSLYGRGYGSAFDNFNSKLQFCDDCAKDEYKDWVYEETEFDEDECYYEDYPNEENLKELIKSLPIEGQELFYNRFAHGAGAHYNMEPQDYIDFILDELQHEKCKDYGFYSPQERLAYKERFPNCANVFIKKYGDGSQGSRCEYGAFGDKNGNVDINIYDKCYMCRHYKPREGDIKIIDETKEYYEHEKKRLVEMQLYAVNRLKELEENLQEYMTKYR